MLTLDLNLLHFSRDRMLSVSREAIDTRSHEEVRAEITGSSSRARRCRSPDQQHARSVPVSPGVRWSAVNCPAIERSPSSRLERAWG